MKTPSDKNVSSGLKSTTSASDQACYSCGRTIQSGESHFGYRPQGQIFNLIRKRFCKDCVEKYGEKVVGMKKQKPQRPVERGPIDEYQ